MSLTSKNAEPLSQLPDLSYREMQKWCKDRGIPANGTKDTIRDRILKHSNDEASKVQTPAKKVEEVTETPKTVEPLSQLSDLSYREMQNWCKERGIPANGSKDIIRDRILKHSNDEASKIQTPAKKVEEVTETGQEPKPRIVTPKRKSPAKTRTSSSSRKRQRIEPGSLKPPKNWEQLYSIVEELRADRTAPLDSDGGEALPERDQGDKVYRFQVLVALMLSSQTKDATVGEAMRALQKHGLTVENIHATESEVLNGLIRKVGFHNNKTVYLKKAAEMLINDYNGDIPPTAEEMMKLAGVGPKMVR